MWRIKEDISGLWKIKEDTSGLWRIKEDTSGLWRIKEDTSGLWRIKEDISGLQTCHSIEMKNLDLTDKKSGSGEKNRDHGPIGYKKK